MLEVSFCSAIGSSALEGSSIIIISLDFAIARAIAIKPKVLILDEATSALDVTVQKEILELLERLREERKMSYLFICHDIALVQNFCDRVLVMHQGKIIEEGSSDEVICHPKEAYTRRLIESVL